MEITEPESASVPPESPEAASVSWPVIEGPAATQDTLEPVEPDVAAPEAVEPDSGSELARAEAEAAVAEAELPPASAEESELIVTDSMAEVFLRQGHKSLALAVYRQLAERSPGSASIGEAIARLEAELAPAQAVPAPEPVRVAHRASETGGRSVGQLLRSVLDAPAPVAASTVLPPAIEPAGEPTRATPDALSLGVVFGDESAPAPTVAEPPTGPEPSYDEFFGAAPAAEVTASGPVGPAETEDLRQFNDWLRGLKR
jgi:hypothetical protein